MGVNPTAAAAGKKFKQQHSQPPAKVDITRRNLHLAQSGAERSTVGALAREHGVMTPTMCSVCSDADIVLATQTHRLRSRRRAFTDVVPAN